VRIACGRGKCERGRRRTGRIATTSQVIELHGVSRIYRPLFGRAVRAVDDLTLQIGDGEVLGIAGPNGAGKSTLLALLLGFQRPTHGTITIGALPPRRYVERNGAGYVSELIAIPPRWRTDRALIRYATLAGLTGSAGRTAATDAITRLGLGEHRTKRIKALSKGNLQRLGMAQATLRRERLYVFDEPTHGLDPVWTARFRDLVATLRGPDTIIVVASHNLDELQRVADRVAILDGGRLQRIVTTGYAPDTTITATYRITVAAGAEHVGAIFPGARAGARGQFDVSVADLAQLNAGLGELLRRGTLIVSVAPAESVLESQFREAIGAGDAAAPAAGSAT